MIDGHAMYSSCRSSPSSPRSATYAASRSCGAYSFRCPDASARAYDTATSATTGATIAPRYHARSDASPLPAAIRAATHRAAPTTAYAANSTNTGVTYVGYRVLCDSAGCWIANASVTSIIHNINGNSSARRRRTTTTPAAANPTTASTYIGVFTCVRIASKYWFHALSSNPPFASPVMLS